ncbi:three-helix bundle dimerization domain-containing protein [Spirillospora sp. CA-142024]|uniref:three-helix bundle dimerization domain-containing protein n=1 Tax=Spirillospora sp. CA-142024 TaxID=3240036 RepID=UPI003D8DC693
MTAQHPPAHDTKNDSAVREHQALREVTTRLRKSFAATHTDEQVTRAVSDAHHRFDGKPIRDFVPILVERMAREQLRAPQTDSPAPRQRRTIVSRLASSLHRAMSRA